MSGVTVPLGFPYPTDADLVQNTDEAIQSLAEAVDDWGVGTDAAIALQPNVAATGDGNRAYRRGNLIVCTFAFSVSAGFAPGATVMVVPAGYRPPKFWLSVLWDASSVAPGGYIAVNHTTGNVQTAGLVSGRSYNGSMSYPFQN